MIMMMTDPDRVAFVRISACILVSFHSPIHANFNAHHLPLECLPLAICHTAYYPIRTSTSVSRRSKFVRFLFVNILTTPDPRRLICAAPLSRSFSISTSLHPRSQQPPKKNLQSVTSRPPFLILCKPARVHAPAFDYLCIYYSWRYLSRTKKKDLLRKRGTGVPKKRRSS